MNSIDLLSAVSVTFKYPWLLLVLIPAVALMLWPYLKMPKQRRRTASRIVSLVLHSVMLVLCAFMLGGMTFEYSRISVKNDVILLVDASDSALGSKGETDEFIEKIIGGVEGDYRVGIVTFGTDQVYAAPLDNDAERAYKRYLESDEKPKGDSTDIAAALMFASDLLSSPSSGRIILLSDGLQTDGNALATVKSLSDAGTRVDTVYFAPHESANEIQIVSVDIPQNVSVGETVPITVTVESSGIDEAELTLWDNGEKAATNKIFPTGGEQAVAFNYTLLSSKFHEFRITVTSPRDTIEENNVYYAYIGADGSKKVLIVDGGENDAEQLSALLSENYDVDTVTPSTLPGSIAELCRYDEVVTVNIANSDLSDSFVDMLTEYVQIFGGGLYTVGGDRAYKQKDMQGSDFEKLLPVEANTDAKTLGLLLVIDCSGSMKETAAGTNSTRIELAIDAAVASVNALGDDDYIGVVTFNAQATRFVEMSPMTRKDNVIRKIKTIDTAVGTQYYNALLTANNMLTPFSSTEMKHIIFLTDGEPVDPDKANFMNEIDKMARNDITLSTIALGASVPIATAKEMAERGNGRFYDVVKESELSKIMVEETTVAAGKYMNEVEFTPSVATHTAAVAGISELPVLGGFYGTRAKSRAVVVLSHESNPIYAEWSCGEGRVGSFMSDLSGKWSAKYFTENSGRQFINNSVAVMLAKKKDSAYAELRTEFIKNNSTTQLRIYSMEKGEIAAKVTSPNGTVTTVALEQLSDDIYGGIFASGESGVYKVEASKAGSDVRITSYMTRSYSDEYRVFTDDTANFAFMENLSKDGGGSVLFSAENLFGKKNEVIRGEFDPRLTFLIICIVLFLLDIVVRKFKIKWPHEIIKEKRERKAGENK